MESLNVALSGRVYPINIEGGLLENCGLLLPQLRQPKGGRCNQYNSCATLPATLF